MLSLPTNNHYPHHQHQIHFSLHYVACARGARGLRAVCMCSIHAGCVVYMCAVLKYSVHCEVLQNSVQYRCSCVQQYRYCGLCACSTEVCNCLRSVQHQCGGWDVHIVQCQSTVCSVVCSTDAVGGSCLGTKCCLFLPSLSSSSSSSTILIDIFYIFLIQHYNCT